MGYIREQCHPLSFGWFPISQFNPTYFRTDLVLDHPETGFQTFIASYQTIPPLTHPLPPAINKYRYTRDIHIVNFTRSKTRQTSQKAHTPLQKPPPPIMSATNYFLQDYATQHREAIRAQAAAEGRTLSVENPECKRLQQLSATQSSSPDQQQQQKVKKTSWWSSIHKNKKSTTAKDQSQQQDNGDAKSLHSFSSGSSY